MPAFGAKTISDLVKDMEGDASMAALEVPGNASIRMKSTEALAALAPGLKAHKAIKTVDFTDCEITDGGCEVLAEIFANNHVIETVVLEKNKITSAGAGKLADGLASNKGIRTLNLLQNCKSFGDECLDHFVTMYSTNITLTKMTWRLDSRKSFMLAKAQTRNIEIQKAIAAGKDHQHLLPDNLRSGAPAPAAAAAPAPAAAEAAPAPAAPAPVAEKAPEPAAAAAPEPVEPVGDPRAVLAEDGKRWTVANHSGGEPIKITTAEKHHTVQIFKCDNATVMIEGKVNGVSIEGCTKTQVVMTDVISSVEVGNSKSIKFQIQGSCPAASIDKTDSCMVYMMSEEAKKMQISTSKHSDVQVTYIAGDEGVERPIPEQFVHFLDGDTVKSSVSSLYSGDAGLPVPIAGAVVADEAPKVEEEPEPPAGEPDARAKLQEDGKRWIIENVDGGDPVMLSHHAKNHTLLIHKCNNATIILDRKINSVAIDSCSKTQVVMTDVISAVEVVNGKSVKFQITGACPSASVDKTDSCMIYLMSEAAKRCQISTSKHSDVQVTYMKGEDPIEKPIPEQFVHLVQPDGSVKSDVSSLYSS